MKDRRKRPAPKVWGTLVEMKHIGDYTAIYDCPHCGQEHTVRLHQTPPVVVSPPCGKGLVKMTRVDEDRND